MPRHVTLIAAGFSSSAEILAREADSRDPTAKSRRFQVQLKLEARPQRVETYIALVRNNLVDDPDVARQVVAQAPLVHRLHGREYAIPDDIKERLGVEELPGLLNLELLPRVGVLDLREAGQQEVTLTPGQTVVALYSAEAEDQHFLSLQLGAGATESRKVKICQITQRQRGHSSVCTDMELDEQDHTPPLSAPVRIRRVSAQGGEMRVMIARTQ